MWTDENHFPKAKTSIHVEEDYSKKTHNVGVVITSHNVGKGGIKSSIQVYSSSVIIVIIMT